MFYIFLIFSKTQKIHLLPFAKVGQHISALEHCMRIKLSIYIHQTLMDTKFEQFYTDLSDFVTC